MDDFPVSPNILWILFPSFSELNDEQNEEEKRESIEEV